MESSSAVEGWTTEDLSTAEGKLKDVFHEAHDDIVERYKTVPTIEPYHIQYRNGLPHGRFRLHPRPCLDDGRERDPVYINETTEDDDPRALEFGTTAAVVTVMKDGSVFAANAGDTTAIISRRGVSGRWVQEAALSECHNSTNKDERVRVSQRKESGHMDYRKSRSTGYLYPVFSPTILQREKPLPSQGIMLTRSLGHKHLAPLGITWEPEVRCTTLKADEEYLILASDGLWEKYVPSQVLKDIATISNLASTVRTLGLTALSLFGSPALADNTTIILLLLRPKT